jgi:RimJ/RimL family protein N-acetyltransferase
VGTSPQRQDPADVRRLTAWRNRHVGCFLTEFEATEARTADWLARVVGARDDKVLFMAEDGAGRTYGYLGLDFIDWRAGRGEADAVVRGEEAPRGSMGRALSSLLRWAKGSLGLHELGVRVRSDNPALGFYARLGFVQTGRLPLRRVEEPGMLRWVPAEAPDARGLELVQMRWEGDR